MIIYRNDLDEYLYIFKKGKIEFNEQQALDCSLEFIDFVDSCLTWDKNKRPKAV